MREVSTPSCLPPSAAEIGVRQEGLEKVRVGVLFAVEAPWERSLSTIALRLIVFSKVHLAFHPNKDVGLVAEILFGAHLLTERTSRSVSGRFTLVNAFWSYSIPRRPQRMQCRLLFDVDVGELAPLDS